jgi:hypothetical protein
MPAFTDRKLSAMFKAFDRVRSMSSEHPDLIARRVINAASAGAETADKLFEMAMRPVNRPASRADTPVWTATANPNDSPAAIVSPGTESDLTGFSISPQDNREASKGGGGASAPGQKP